MDELALARNTLKSLEKKLYSLNTLLREAYRVKELFDDVKEVFSDLKSILSSRPEVDPLIREYVRDQELLPVVRDVAAKYEALVELLRDYNSFLDEMVLFFEKYRNYRYYLFSSEDLPVFVSRLFEDEGEVLFRQALTRRTFTKEFADEVGAIYIDPFSLRVSEELLPVVIDKFMHRYNTGFIIESKNYTLTYKPESGLVKVVFFNPSRIDRADSLAKRLGGEILSV